MDETMETLSEDEYKDEVPPPMFDALPDFPLQKPEDFQLFEMECSINDRCKEQLRQLILANDYEDVARFLRGNLRYLFTDLAAVPFSWYGKRGNISVADYVSINVLIETCLSVFKTATIEQCQKLIQTWFQYANDRIKKRAITLNEQ